MPKIKGKRRSRVTGGKSQKRPLPSKTGTPLVSDVSRGREGAEGESEADDELGQEQLEGLENIEDMEMISKMGLDVKDGTQKKKRKNESTISRDSFEEASWTNIPPEAGRRGKRKRREMKTSTAGSDESGGEDGASWEGVRRGGSDEKMEEVHYLLPLKTRGGLVLQPPVPNPNAPGGDSAEEEEEEEEGDGVEVEEPATRPEQAAVECLSTAALLARREAILEEKRAAIADIASSVVEAPEDGISRLQRLLTMCSERETQVACTVRKMAMASLTAVFRDIAPSYHIRELSEEEKATKVSKDVRKLRVFEETLLSVYQQFLTLLNDYIIVGLGKDKLGGGQAKRRKDSKRPLDILEDNHTLSLASMQSLGEVAMRCMCELLLSLPHFNFRNNIISVIVPRMVCKNLNGMISQLCCETIERVFREDLVGEVSLECVRLILKLIKSKSYNTRPAVLRSFLHLQLHSVDQPVGGGGGGGGGRGGKKSRGRGPGEKLVTGKTSQLTRKQRKRLKAERELDKDLKEAEATESGERKSKLQTEVLQLVFATYFHILKSTRHSPLLQPVLEGLAKFAHLISVDFFSDLMSVLHSLAETGGLSNKECMLCVLTAFEILSGQGEALNIDPRQFYVQLYGALLQLDTVSSNEDVVLALNCMDKMMRKRRQVSLQRVLGFVKRLSTISLQLMPGACLAVLGTVRKCMLAYSQCEQLLDSDGACGGVFRPDVPDPEMSQAGSTLLWEYTIYSRHYSPALRGYATHLLHGAPTVGRHALNPDIAKRGMEELVSSLSGLCLTAALPKPPPHPATKLARKNREYYYRDCGIRDEVISEVEQEANRVAEEVNNFELHIYTA